MSRVKISGKAYIQYTLKEFKIPFELEYQFNKSRKFRFDFFFELGDKKIGVEYDGLFAGKSRHTTVGGFSRDTEKTNLAALNGFIVLRYTAMTYKNFYDDLKLLINEHSRNNSVYP